jgi:diguanylate cyclase (GGDEF)-like protein
MNTSFLSDKPRNNSRPVVGVLFDHLVEYHGRILEGVRSVLEPHGYAVVAVVGRELDLPEPSRRLANSIYALAAHFCWQGFIVSSGTMTNYIDTDTFQTFLRTFGVPKVGLGDTLPGLPSVTTEDRASMRALTEHLINRCGHQTFALMRGVAGNRDSDMREGAVRQVLQEHGIPLAEENVLSGYFARASAYCVTQQWLAKGHQAQVMIALNDDMAYGISQALLANGLRVPQDMAVTGVDNSSVCKVMTPALTSVGQDLRGQGVAAAQLLLQQLGGKRITQQLQIPSRLIVRASCGVPASRESTYAVPSEAAKQNVDAHQISLAINAMEHNALSSPTFADLTSRVAEFLPSLGVKQCYMALYPEPAPAGQQGSDVRLTLAYQGGKVFSESQSYPAASLLPPSIKHMVLEGTLVLQPLYFADTYYGFVLTEFDLNHCFFYETLRHSLSNVVRHITQLQQVRGRSDELEHLVRARTEELSREIAEHERLEQALWEANAQLSQLARTDSLTGLYNRLAFQEYLAQQWASHQREGSSLSIILCDVDFFKGYNDSYGHPAGDLCLQKIAEVLRSCAQRTSDYPVRLGGEEFALMLPQTNADGAGRVARCIQKTLARLALPHAQSAAGRTVTLSLGVATLVPNLHQPSSALLDEADKALYQAKQRGRNCVVSLTDGRGTAQTL